MTLPSPREPWPGKSALAKFAVTCTMALFLLAPDACRAVTINHLENWSSWVTAKDYLLDMEQSAQTGNEQAAKLQALKPLDENSLATIFQPISPAAYRGKRLRYTALVKTHGVTGGAGLWMTVENPDDVVSFDDMSNRAIRGTKDWKKYSIVLNVPDDSQRLRFGFMLKGGGTALMKNPHIEEVDTKVRSTNRPFDQQKFRLGQLDSAPRNLDFTDGKQDHDHLRLNNWAVNMHSGSKISLDTANEYLGRPSCCIKFADPQKDSRLALGTIHQFISADKYLGKRLKFSGYVKTDAARDWCALFMQVDGGGKVMAFDAMEERPVKGSTDWHKVDIVLDVPPQSRKIKIGFMLAGSGSAWLSHCSLDEVATQVPTTGVAPDTLAGDRLPQPYMRKKLEPSFE